MTTAHMHGREEMEWKDRSWGLLENKGELKTDWVTTSPRAHVRSQLYIIATQKGKIPLRVGNAVLGGAGMGSAAGVHVCVICDGKAPSSKNIRKGCISDGTTSVVEPLMFSGAQCWPILSVCITGNIFDP
ncbi:hypothetical protein PtrARCrB10_03080 [Pyrenophora tritici-repentis]|nr:hypothetical protein PtrARCrB10_03080 [Pyrenophora tritici-repentis]